MIDLIVKSIKKQLADAYSKDNIHIYDEDIPQDFKEPCFYISVLNTSKTNLLKERFILNIPVVVQYFPNNKSKDKKAEINNKIMELLELLKAVKLFEIDETDQTKLKEVGMLNGFNINSEVVDNVLSFFVEYKPTLRRKPEEIGIMEELEQVLFD